MWGGLGWGFLIKTCNMKTLYNEPIIWNDLKAKARENRNKPTFAEKVVWNILRFQNLGVKFRRQHVIYYYIVDFVCLELGLIIEIDGNSHLETQDYDENRTLDIENLGFKVIRFNNIDVLERSNWVEEQIKNVIAKLKIKNPTPTLPTK